MSLKNRVKNLEKNLLALEFRFNILYGFLKEQDTVTEGELKDYIERQVMELTPEQKKKINEKVKLPSRMEKIFETVTSQNKE